MLHARLNTSLWYRVLENMTLCSIMKVMEQA